MRFIAKHWARIAVSLIPLIFALGHASGMLHLGVVKSLDNIIYDARLRLTMPKTMDSRIVIVDIDEKSLAEVGHWPWGRNKLAELSVELLKRQQVALLGFDLVFAESDNSSGLRQLKLLAQTELRGESRFQDQIARLQDSLDYDALFAQALNSTNVVLGYYFTSDRGARISGVLPQPVITGEVLKGQQFNATKWDGYGSNIQKISQAAPQAGFFNAIADDDGVVRATPLLAQYKNEYYESLALAMYRAKTGRPEVQPIFSKENVGTLQRVLLAKEGQTTTLAVDDRAAVLVPFRGYGGADGGSFQYISAADVLSGRLPSNMLKGKIVLLGATAPGLQDLRVTPVGQTYPGVETHANLLSSMLDGASIYKPDYAMGYEVFILLLTGLVLVFLLPGLNAARALLLHSAVLIAAVALNFYLFMMHGMVLPLAAVLLLSLVTFTLNMSYGYFIESRSRRELTQLFGSYVPPQLVEEMAANPQDHTMRAESKDMTVMFCDMRGFTQLSESMEPIHLQEMLNGVFGRLTDLILARRGTIDKYMGDCVMAFWGAPVTMPNHAELAVQAAMDITHAMTQINEEHVRRGFPQIRLGIGVNTGTMCVGDMGSFLRRSFTVVGDAVNLASRLEELTKIYAVEILIGQNTKLQAPQFSWQEIDKVSVHGKRQVLEIYTPLGRRIDGASVNAVESAELSLWNLALQAYRAQNWDHSEQYLYRLMDINPKNALYPFYVRRIALLRLHEPGPAWDGTSSFQES